MSAAPTCGIGECAATAICRYRIKPRSPRTLWDAEPYWVNACGGHWRNAGELGFVIGMESLHTGEPARIVWTDEEAKA